MSTVVVKAFSPHLFNHHVGLERQFNDSETLLTIESAASNEPATLSRYFSRWQIVWITLKHPLEQFASLLFRAISFGFRQIYFEKGARIFSVLSKHMMRDWQQVNLQWQFNGAEELSSSPLLMPAFNVHQMASWDVYTQSAIPQSFLIDKDVISMTSHHENFKQGIKQALEVFYTQLEKARRKEAGWWISSNFKPSKDEKIRIRRVLAERYANSPADAIQFLKKFYPVNKTDKPLNKLYGLLKQVDTYLAQNCREISLYSDGLCRGASLWFIHLYKKTADKFKDPLQHLLAVAAQFKNGVPKQGAILQSLEKGERLMKMNPVRLKDYELSLYELDHDHDSAVSKIESIGEGIYRMGIAATHSLVYVKIQGVGYLWDPGIGLLAMNAKQVLHHILENYYLPGNRQSQVYFESYDLYTRSHS